MHQLIQIYLLIRRVRFMTDDDNIDKVVTQFQPELEIYIQSLLVWWLPYRYTVCCMKYTRQFVSKYKGRKELVTAPEMNSFIQLCIYFHKSFELILVVIRIA